MSSGKYEHSEQNRIMLCLYRLLNWMSHLLALGILYTLRSLIPRPIPSFSVLHTEKWRVMGVAKLGMGLGMWLYTTCHSNISLDL